MRVVVVSQDRDAAAWLEAVLLSSGLSVVVLPTADPASPELDLGQLLIADHVSSQALGGAGPERRLLLVPRGQAVDLATAMGGGFMDLLVVPSPEDDILGRVGRALDQFLKPAPSGDGQESQIAELKDVVDRVVAALREASGRGKAEAYALAEGMLSVFSLLIDSHEATGRGTPGHSRRTGAIVQEVATKLGMSDEQVAWLSLAGRLHDLGMVVLDLPLSGQNPLQLELRRALVKHPQISATILAALKRFGFPVDAVAAHHERPDGSGYPKGLEGEAVTLEAQVLGACDVYEALVSARPWRAATDPEDAVDAISRMGFAEPIIAALRDVTAVDSHLPHRLTLPQQD